MSPTPVPAYNAIADTSPGVSVFGGSAENGPPPRARPQGLGAARGGRVGPVVTEGRRVHGVVSGRGEQRGDVVGVGAALGGRQQTGADARRRRTGVEGARAAASLVAMPPAAITGTSTAAATRATNSSNGVVPRT